MRRAQYERRPVLPPKTLRIVENFVTACPRCGAKLRGTADRFGNCMIPFGGKPCRHGHKVSHGYITCAGCNFEVGPKNASN